MSLQDVEALLRAELADVADGVPSGPVPVSWVVARGRTARRRRRAAGAAGAVLGTLAALLAVSMLDTDAVRSDPPPPAATSAPPEGRPDRGGEKVSLPSRAVMMWIASLPAGPQTPSTSGRPGIGTPLDAAGFPRLPAPDGAAFVTLRPVGAGWELQLRDVESASVVQRAPAPQSAQPVGWLGGSVVLSDLDGGPGLWRPGDRPRRIDGADDTEEVASIAGNRLLLRAAQGLRSQRCRAGHRAARVIEVMEAGGVAERWRGCAQTSAAQLSPDGRWVVDSRNWFVPIEVSTGRRVPGATGVDTGGTDLSADYDWDPAGRWLQVEVGYLADGENVRTFVRCSIADGTCVRLTDPDATQTNSPT